MIQRVQSVYLFLAAILTLATPFFQIMGIRFDEPQTFSLFSLGSYSFLPNFVSPAFSLIAGILAFVTIFLYKKRKLQIKICYWILGLIVFLYIFIFYSFIVLMSKAAGASFFPKVAIGFPVIALFLVCMAIAGIKKDQKIVSSLDRLR